MVASLVAHTDCSLSWYITEVRKMRRRLEVSASQFPSDIGKALLGGSAHRTDPVLCAPDFGRSRGSAGAFALKSSLDFIMASQCKTSRREGPKVQVPMVCFRIERK